MKVGFKMKMVYFAFGLFFLLFAVVNYYIGLRGWQYLGQYLLNKNLYWGIFWCIALSYLAARAAGGFLPIRVQYVATLLGSYWLGAMFYLLQILIVIDLMRFLNNKLHFIPGEWVVKPPLGGVLVFVIVAVLLIYGTINAHNPRISRYEICINKESGLRQLHAVMVSDIHLGEIMHHKRLVKLVYMVNRLEPDILFLPGDVIDEDIGPFIRQDMAATFQKIRTKYGKYAVPGNHEYIGGHIDKAVQYMEQAGITVLRDEYIKLKEGLYIIGRDDNFHARIGGSPKQRELSQVMEGVDRSLPVILLNHQPTGLSEAERLGVDLQLSGHTHRGQFFPNNLITQALFAIDWGYLQKGGLQVIVSSGFGTWGPPIRIGNRPEIVELFIKFK